MIIVTRIHAQCFYLIRYDRLIDFIALITIICSTADHEALFDRLGSGQKYKEVFQRILLYQDIVVPAPT